MSTFLWYTSASRCFQPGESPSKVLLSDCETSNFAKVRVQLYRGWQGAEHDVAHDGGGHEEDEERVEEDVSGDHREPAVKHEEAGPQHGGGEAAGQRPHRQEARGDDEDT